MWVEAGWLCWKQHHDTDEKASGTW
jgi:hypothetical protein